MDFRAALASVEGRNVYYSEFSQPPFNGQMLPTVGVCTKCVCLGAPCRFQFAQEGRQPIEQPVEPGCIPLTQHQPSPIQPGDTAGASGILAVSVLGHAGRWHGVPTNFHRSYSLTIETEYSIVDEIVGAAVINDFEGVLGVRLNYEASGVLVASLTRERARPQVRHGTRSSHDRQQ
ncbi:hypothetical protein [Nocardia barduliensis]|uniref:hypothetical protein n=1 Tax=Nocardia barduliensis TaxID=2736643 RepID=UPI001572BBCA|nr:hypothetical protein [Nocardia barduliensis]